jgi:hypothetical protein
VGGHGLIVSASVLLLVLGCFNLIYGIAAIASPHVFTPNAHYVSGSLRTWGWITLILGILSSSQPPGSWRATSWRAGWPWPWPGATPLTRCSSSPPASKTPRPARPARQNKQGLTPPPQGRLSGCFFSIITRQAIRRGSCTSVRQLTATTGAFIDHWNDYPRPFAWTRDAEGDPRQNLPRED